jgi:hypothetical protein
LADLDITAIIVGIISLISSAAIAIITYRLTSKNDTKLECLRNENNNKLEKLRSQLEMIQSEKKALIDYKNEAQKRLYLEFEPLSFQLVELSEHAMRRIRGLAREAREGHMGLKENWYADDTSVHMINAIYRLLAPLAVFRLMQRKLTYVDLTLDKSVNLRYKLAKVLYYSFTHDQKTAGKCLCPIIQNYYRGRNAGSNGRRKEKSRSVSKTRDISSGSS